MKLATYNDGSRDGLLVVVSRDLSSAHHATGIATRLQQVLDDWSFLSPQLEDLSVTLNQGRARHAFAFDPRQCMAPLPRAHQHVSAPAYPSHGQRLSGAAAGIAADAATGLRQCASDAFLGPCDDLQVPSDKMGIDFGAQLSVITGDLACGVSVEQALEGVRLLMLSNAWVLRHLPAGSVQAAPGTAFGPVALTPDELGPAWRGGRVHLPLQSSLNGKRFGLCEAGSDMDLHFGQWLAQLCKTRRIAAGSVLGSGTVSNLDAKRGHGCIAEKRALEAEASEGQARTPYLSHGDSVRIDMKNADGHSLFGAIEQSVATLDAAA